MLLLRITVLVFLTVLRLTYAEELENPIKKPIVRGRAVHVRRFAHIWDYEGKAPNIQGMTMLGSDMYVCTGTSGGLIFKISPKGVVKQWFDVAAAMKANKRKMSFDNEMHGGLRSVAFHPDFKKNGLLYTSLMESTKKKDTSKLRYLSKPKPPLKSIDADSVVHEWKVDKRGNVMWKSMREVIRIGMHVYDHPIKQMVFYGPYLYIGHGDGSFQSSEVGGGQNNDGLGKIIRIDPLQNGDEPYSIPSSNPYLKDKKYMGELYAVGFRNPHNLCFSKKGELFVTDAGRDNVEEINIVKAGGNYGWSLREGPFVHLPKGGLMKGIKPLPKKDPEELIYPNVAVGHVGKRGDNWVGQALTGACPVENKSAMTNVFFYCNFPTDGNLYYSKLSDMRNAKTSGNLKKLTQATTYKASILYDDDDNPKTEPIELENLRDVVRQDFGLGGVFRADIRFGRGVEGEIYFSSKANGRIYVISSTVPGFKEPKRSKKKKD